MPQKRGWTLLVVPHHAPDAPRTLSISERAMRRLAGTATILGLVAAVGIGVAISRLALRIRGQDDAGAREGLLALQTRLDSLHDTLQAITRRDQQIRLLAGLPQDSLVPHDDSGEAVAADMTAPVQKPGALLGSFSLNHSIDIDVMIRRANSLAASFAEVSDTLAHNAEKLARIPSIMPTAGWLSSAFSRSRFHPILHIARPHEGIDVSAPMGAPIVAPAAGTVIEVTKQSGYGNVLEIDHGNGIVTKYAHCSRIVVRQGQHVKRGQQIANVGNTGLSTGPHLHYEIHVNGRVVDPLTYVLPGSAIPD